MLGHVCSVCAYVSYRRNLSEEDAKEGDCMEESPIEFESRFTDVRMFIKFGKGNEHYGFEVTVRPVNPDYLQCQGSQHCLDH